MGSHQLQPNPNVAQVIGVAAIGFEGLSAFLEEPRELFFEKLRRERLPHLPNPSTATFDTHITHTETENQKKTKKW